MSAILQPELQVDKALWGWSIYGGHALIEGEVQVAFMTMWMARNA